MMLLPRAIQHLVTHALKAAPAHTRVTVQVEYPGLPSTQSTAPRLRISVRNESQKLPSEDLERLFDKYALVNMHQRGKAHTGLGLAYCKIVVEAHGGSISAANVEPQGIVFTIEL
jgi:K+-sensing histidine kinase KdpD